MAVHELHVSIYGRHAGVITCSGGKVRFAYDESYADDNGATPLSLSLPLESLEHQRRPVMAYLDGLLPDHVRVRSRWAQEHRVTEGDVISLIGAVGLDVAGAVQFHTDPTAAQHAGGLRPIDDLELEERIRHLREDGADWAAGDPEAFWSLAGAQSKFTLARDGDHWAIATGSAPSTHILKPGITALEDQALIEHVSMRALSAVGLDVARTEYAEFGAEPAIIIERYDRRTRRSTLRIHQEDLTQAFALMPERKYEDKGGPGLQQIGQLLGGIDTEGRTRFADAIIANYLIGAPDAHAKNYSLLLVRRSAMLAPLYDVASGLTYRKDDTLRFTKAAMSIGGERHFGAVQPEHWRKAAKNLGVDAGGMLERVRELASTIPDALRDEVERLPHEAARQRLRDKLVPAAARLSADTLESLATVRERRWAEGRAAAIAAAGPQPRKGKGLGGGQFMHTPQPPTTGTLPSPS
jgi:serine/threonine-protein kinase HipA